MRELEFYDIISLVSLLSVYEFMSVIYMIRLSFIDQPLDVLSVEKPVNIIGRCTAIGSTLKISTNLSN